MSRMELFTIEIYILEKRTGCLKVHFKGFSQRTHAHISRGMLPAPFSRWTGLIYLCRCPTKSRLSITPAGRARGPLYISIIKYCEGVLAIGDQYFLKGISLWVSEFMSKCIQTYKAYTINRRKNYAMHMHALKWNNIVYS